MGGPPLVTAAGQGRVDPVVFCGADVRQESPITLFGSHDPKIALAPEEGVCAPIRDLGGALPPECVVEEWYFSYISVI